MRRVGSTITRRALVTLPVVRWQSNFSSSFNPSQGAPAQATTQTTSAQTNPTDATNNTPASGSFYRPPQQPFFSNRPFTPQRLLPRFEIFDVRDNPALGSMTRVAVDSRQLLVSQYPQLGPRKVDPNDFSPQFDNERRISVRFRHKDLAGFIAVMEDKMTKYSVKNNAYDLHFEKTSTGYILSGLIHRVTSTKMEEWSVQFENQFAVTLEHFLQDALTESFGFRAFHNWAQTHPQVTEGVVYGGNNNYNNQNVGATGGSGGGGFANNSGASNFNAAYAGNTAAAGSYPQGMNYAPRGNFYGAGNVGMGNRYNA